MPGLLDRAKAGAAAYAAGGADAVIVENVGDVPFAAGAVGPHVVAAMTLAVATVRTETGLPVGVNVLRNHVSAEVAIAALGGGSFVRVNVYVGAAMTDQGIIQGRAEEVQRPIRRLDTPIAVWADVDVKHAAPLVPRPLADAAADAVERGLVAAIIVTGRTTGLPVAPEDLSAVRTAVADGAVSVGNCVTATFVADLLRPASGVIVGAAAERDGQVAAPVDPRRARAIVDAAAPAAAAATGASPVVEGETGGQ